MAEKTVAGVRNAEDGNAARAGSLTARTPPGDVAKRAPRTPRKALAVATPTAGTRRRTLKRSEAHEGMKPQAQASGGRRAVKTVSPVGNDEDNAGPGNPMTLAAERISTP